MPKDTEIYLVDSYGKTKSFFKLCKIVFLGGSLIKHGGQNPLEAAKYGCKILHGPNIWNFKEIYDLLKEFKITGKIKDTNQMKRIIQDLLNKKNNSTQIKTKIKKLGNKIFKTKNKFIYCEKMKLKKPSFLGL